MGIEGWAGYDADKKRGRQILNAEEILIKALLKNKSYSVIGLEEPSIQIQALELSLPELYGEFYRIENEIIKKMLDYDVSSEKARSSLLAFYSHARKAEVIFWLINDSSKAKSNPLIKNEMISYLEVHLGAYLLYLNFIISCLNDVYNVDIRSFNRKIQEKWGLFVEKKFPKLYEYHLTKTKTHPEIENVRMNLREEYATKRMLIAMINHNKNIGIVVFGVGHTDGLIKEFLKQTNKNVNILVLE